MPASLEYVAKETATNLWRNRMMALAAILTVAVSLSLVGTALLLRQSVNRQIGQWSNNVSLQVFMNADATPQQLALIFGKDGNAYLANPNNLGGVSDPLATFKAATNEIICAPALYTTSTATYVAYKGAGAKCTTGSGAVSTLKIVPGSPPTLAGSWCAPGGNSSPMVTTSDGTHDVIVWSPGSESDMLLHGYDGDTGAVVFGGGGVKIPNMRRYNTPIAAKGRIFVAADFTVVAFKP